MTPEQLLKLRQQYQKEIADAQAKLEALDDVGKFIKTTPASSKSKKTKKNKSEYSYDPSQDLNKTEIMRRSLEHLGDTFKTKNFMNYLKRNYPSAGFSEAFVSNTLAKFIKKEGLVEIVNKGEKRKGYIYRRKTG